MSRSKDTQKSSTPVEPESWGAFIRRIFAEEKNATTEREIGEHLGVGKTMVSGYLNNPERYVSPNKAYEIASVFPDPKTRRAVISKWESVVFPLDTTVPGFLEGESALQSATGLIYIREQVRLGVSILKKALQSEPEGPLREQMLDLLFYGYAASDRFLEASELVLEREQVAKQQNCLKGQVRAYLDRARLLIMVGMPNWVYIRDLYVKAKGLVDSSSGGYSEEEKAFLLTCIYGDHAALLCDHAIYSSGTYDVQLAEVERALSTLEPLLDDSRRSASLVRRARIYTCLGKNETAALLLEQANGLAGKSPVRRRHVKMAKALNLIAAGEKIQALELIRRMHYSGTVHEDRYHLRRLGREAVELLLNVPKTTYRGN